MDPTLDPFSLVRSLSLYLSLSVSSSLLCGLLYSRELTLEHCANGYSVTVVQLGLRTNLATVDRCWGAFGYSEAYYFLYR